MKVSSQKRALTPSNITKYADSGQDLMGPSYKRNRPSENVSPYCGVDSQLSETWKSCNTVSHSQIEYIPSAVIPGVGPSVSPSNDIRISSQPCIDFEEKGFCLKGDMCPMEHGVNPIVVEDVESLSQFNLPISLHSKSSKMVINEDGSLGMGVEMYDPDQPNIFTNDTVETSQSLLPFDRSNANEKTESLLDGRNIKSYEAFNERPIRSVATSGSKSSHPLGRIGTSKNDSIIYTKKPLPHRGSVCNVQKAIRTLFVSSIPMKDNRREALVSHFQKFGEVVSYTRMHTDTAFVQFSKREEAEAALKAPDAVMGNRFIQIRWAKKDSNTDDEILNRASPSPSSPPNKGKENPCFFMGKISNAPSSVSQGPVDEHRMINRHKSPPILQKKMESIELLREEIRKKQKMMGQKRN